MNTNIQFQRRPKVPTNQSILSFQRVHNFCLTRYSSQRSSSACLSSSLRGFLTVQIDWGARSGALLVSKQPKHSASIPRFHNSTLSVTGVQQ